MSQYKFDYANIDSEKSPQPKPFIGVPFCFYAGEFVPRELTPCQWLVRHRDSKESAVLVVGFRNTQPSETTWRVTTTLFEGTAEFKNYLAAERFVATILRANAGRRHYGGEPQSRFSFDEIWWSATSDVFKLNAGYLRISPAASRLKRLAMDAVSQITRLMGRVLTWPFSETHKLLNLSRTKSRARR